MGLLLVELMSEEGAIEAAPGGPWGRGVDCKVVAKVKILSVMSESLDLN